MEQDVARLVDRRAALLSVRSADRSADERDELEQLTSDLGSLFERSPPVVRRLVPETPDEPGALARELAAREPVHPVVDVDDLSDRLAADRRCFLLEHPDVPGRPLNVVWCALMDETPSRIGEVLDPAAPTSDPASADTAVFYSIWSAEPGLQGLPGGRPLIEGAVELLLDELPGLSTFVTLSPLPGLRAWRERSGQHDEPDAEGARTAATTYLTSLDERGRPLDPVARFHLGNGARLVAIHPDADPSEKGRRQSFGVMANYRYVPEDRASNRTLLAAGHVPVGGTIHSG